MDNSKETVPIWLPRAAGIAAAWAVSWAAEHKLHLDPDELVALGIATYAFLHRAISKKVNPSDAVKASLVKEARASVEMAAVEQKTAEFMASKYSQPRGD